MNLPLDAWCETAWTQIWQVTLLAVGVGVIVRLACRRRPHLAHAFWMLVILKCLTPPLWSSPTGVFSWLQVRQTLLVAEVSLPEYKAIPSSPGHSLLLEKMICGRPEATSDSSAADTGSASSAESGKIGEQPETLPSFHFSWPTTASAFWALGVLTLAGVSLGKAAAFARVLRRYGVSADVELEALALRIAARLGIRRKVRLRIVSEPVGPAVFGLWRPVVVLPEAIVREKTLREMEPILAHELVHVRRGDTWLGVLKLAAQVAWWFHPLVWWANRELDRRREQCCDEEVVAGLGCCPAAYARCLVDVLDWERRRGRRRPFFAAAGVGAAKITTARLEHIMDDSKRFYRRTPRWMWGVLAASALVFLPGGAMVLGYSDGSTSTKEAKEINQSPTLDQIAQANDAAWAKIRSVDFEYTTSGLKWEGKKVIADYQVPYRWTRSGNVERLRKYPATIKVNRMKGCTPVAPNRLIDYFSDGPTARYLDDTDPGKKDRGKLSRSDQQGFYGQIYPKQVPSLAAQENSEPLHYIDFACGWGDRAVTLSTILRSWKASLTGKKTTPAGETLWLLHAEYPAEDQVMPAAGSYVDFEINVDKGFLIQKATFFRAFTRDGKNAGIYMTKEIKEFRDCGQGVFFPVKMEQRWLGETLTPDPNRDKYEVVTLTATRLAVNAPLPADALDFRFPENFEVQQVGEKKKFYVWGPDNKPAKEFDTAMEFQAYKNEDEFKAWAALTEKNRASKKPEVMFDRGAYYLAVKKYDEAVAVFSEILVSAPEKKDQKNALAARGFVYLISQREYGKAIADFTEALRLAKDQKDQEDISSIYFFRAMAYINQEDNYEKALADLEKINVPSPQDGPSDYCVPLLRSAVRIRFLFGANPDKTEAINEAEAKKQVMLIWQDLDAASQGSGNAPDTLAVMACFLERGKNPEAAKQFRQQAQHAPVELSEGDGAVMDAAIHRCLVRLLPEIEKKLSK